MKKEKIDRSKMGFIVTVGCKEIKCKTEEEAWEIVYNTFEPYMVTYEDGYWAKQFIPF